MTCEDLWNDILFLILKMFLEATKERIFDHEEEI